MKISNAAMSESSAENSESSLQEIAKLKEVIDAKDKTTKALRDTFMMQYKDDDKGIIIYYHHMNKKK